jgi:hypothetical protein
VSAPEVAEVRIERRGGFEIDIDHPFSEVFITTTDGRHFYTRLFHTIDDSPHARAFEAQAFRRRLEAAERQMAPERLPNGTPAKP